MKGATKLPRLAAQGRAKWRESFKSHLQRQQHNPSLRVQEGLSRPCSCSKKNGPSVSMDSFANHLLDLWVGRQLDYCWTDCLRCGSQTCGGQKEGKKSSSSPRNAKGRIKKQLEMRKQNYVPRLPTCPPKKETGMWQAYGRLLVQNSMTVTPEIMKRWISGSIRSAEPRCRKCLQNSISASSRAGFGLKIQQYRTFRLFLSDRNKSGELRIPFLSHLT